jgi:voltage-gated potassium channel Kch
MSEERTEDYVDPPSTVWGTYSTQVIVTLSVAVVGLGTVAYRYLEDWGWVDSLYFSVITLTSVGYGDLAPSTSGSKLFTVFYIVTGLSLLGASLNEIVKRRGRHRAARRAERTS